MKKSIVFIFYFFKSIIAQSQHENILTIESSQDIEHADTNMIYELVSIYEPNTLFDNIDKISRLHFEILDYRGNKRVNFPFTQNKIHELKIVYIISTSLSQIPNFIIIDSLSSFNIEAYNCSVDFDLSKCKKLKTLSLFCKDANSHINEICELINLESLSVIEGDYGFQTSLSCISNLKKLKGLGISLKAKDIFLLNDCEQLKNISIYSKVNYRDIEKNLSTFQNFDSIHFYNFKGSKKQLKKIKELLPNCRVSANFHFIWQRW